MILLIRLSLHNILAFSLSISLIYHSSQDMVVLLVFLFILSPYHNTMMGMARRHNSRALWKQEREGKCEVCEVFITH